MKSHRVIVGVAALAIGGSIALAGQSGSASVSGQASTQSDSTPTSAQYSAQTNAVTDHYLTSVQTELIRKVDSKNAVVGQEVTARTRQNATLADGTELPKGTQLVGRVTQVQASEKGGAGSMLAMIFDHAELRGGQVLPLHSVMRGVAPAAFVTASDSSTDSLMAVPASPMGGNASGSGNGRSGGAAVGGSGSARGAPVRTAGVGPTLGGALDPVTRTPGGVVSSAGENVSSAPRATGLPGIMLSTSASADASGTLTAAGKNISLDSGTQITLGVIAR